MQVKKFTAETIVQALQDVKRDLGPDAIILSTKEERRSMGRQPHYTVVAAVSDNQLLRKQVTEKTLGQFTEKFAGRSAIQQKQIISSVVDKISEKQRYKNPQVTTRRYADIAENESVSSEAEDVATVAQEPGRDGEARVKNAVREAFKSSLSSQFLPFQKKEKNIRI